MNKPPEDTEMLKRLIKFALDKVKADYEMCHLADICDEFLASEKAAVVSKKPARPLRKRHYVDEFDYMETWCGKD